MGRFGSGANRGGRYSAAPITNAGHPRRPCRLGRDRKQYGQAEQKYRADTEGASSFTNFCLRSPRSWRRPHNWQQVWRLLSGNAHQQPVCSPSHALTVHHSRQRLYPMLPTKSSKRKRTFEALHHHLLRKLRAQTRMIRGERS